MDSDQATAAVETRLSIDLFGGFAIRLGDRPLEFRNKKACAIIAYLLLEGKPSESRDRLAGLLWSEYEEEKARASLRQCLRQLRELFEGAAQGRFGVDRTHVRLEPGSLAVDFLAVLAAVRAGRVDERLLLRQDLPGQLLRGYGALDPAFRAWLIVKRQSLHDMLVHSLELILDAADAPRATRDRAADALIQLDPTHEKACRRTIAALAEKGNIAGALRVYKQLWTLLGDDYDMEPAAETQALIAQIKAGLAEKADPSKAGRAVPALVDSTLESASLTIGMTKFIQNPPDPKGDYFVEGFRRDLIASLVRFREWIILDRDDITASSGLASDRAQSIDYLIEGTGFGDGDERHLIITLKDVRKGQYVWSERYQLTTGNWFATHQKIIRRTSMALNVHISAERLAKQVSEPAMALGAYDLWLKGQALIQHWSPDAEDQAEEIFRKIVDRTPDFGPAYSSLASIYNSRHIVFPGVFRNRKHEAEAQKFAMIAVEIDPLDTRAQLALAWSNVMRGRYEQAELHYGLSYDLNSSDPATLISCAQGLAFCGQHERARGLSDLATSMNPVLPAYHWGYLVGIRFICGDLEGSLEAADCAQDVIANLPGWRAAALSLLDRRDEARAAADQFLAMVEDQWLGQERFSGARAVAWFLHSFPIRDAEVCARLREGLQQAGLPVP